MGVSCGGTSAVLALKPVTKGKGSFPKPRSRWVKLDQPGCGVADSTLRAALVALLEAIGAKDQYTWGHSVRVGRYAWAIARELGLPEQVCEEIALAAELHDVGKIGVPDELLRKPGPLSEAERRRVLEHTVIGERILAPVFSGHPTILAVVRWHHERVDGTGYPDGLERKQIPLAARIVAVADAFDAMRTARPYRASLGLRAVLAELQCGSGSQFDPACVAALLAVLRRWALQRRSRVVARRLEKASGICRSREVRWLPSGRVMPQRGAMGPPLRLSPVSLVV